MDVDAADYDLAVRLDKQRRCSGRAIGKGDHRLPIITERWVVQAVGPEAHHPEAAGVQWTRFVENNGTASGLTELFSAPDIGTFPDNHIGGNIHFGADGKLYITIGDDGVSTNAQDVTKKNGKIHRINPDGSIPSDNPVFTQTGALPSLYSRGQRNSFDFDFDPLTRQLWASDNGPECDDEFNRIVAGGNYSWRNYPQDYKCAAANDEDNNPNPTNNTVNPAWWEPNGVCCDAPTGVEFYTGSRILPWANEPFMCSFGGNKSGGKLRHMHLSADRRSVTSVGVVAGVTCNMDIETGPDGALYYIEGGGGGPGTIKRIVGTAVTSSLAWPRYGIDAAINIDSASLAESAAAGATAIRVYITWSSIEGVNTSPKSYSWTSTDALFARIEAAGLQAHVIIYGCPAWACSNDNGPIDKVPLTEFVEFTRALAARYSTSTYNVHNWEFWNEPDSLINGNGALGWAMHGAEYANMLAAVSPTMRQADPQVSISLGGLGYDWFTTDTPTGPFYQSFLGEVLDRLKVLGATSALDYIPFHYYAKNIHWPNIIAKASEVRGIIRSRGLNIPLVMNETGLTSSSNPDYGTPKWGPNSPEIQARYLVQTFAQANAARDRQLHDMPGIFWFTSKDFAEDGPFQSFAQAGLITLSGTRKPSFYAYQAFKQEVGDSEYLRQATSAEVGGAQVEAHIFAGSSRPVWVMWSTTSAMQTVTFDSSQVVRVLNMCGQELAVAAGDATCPQGQAPSVSYGDTGVTVTFGENPVFLERPRFSDVPRNFFAYTDVEYLAQNGIISGYSDNTFRPFNNTTRGQVTKIIVLGEGWAIDTTGGPHFKDVPTTNPFYGFIETAYNHGTINGYSNASDCGAEGAPCFHWEANVTRGQLTKIIVLAEGWSINTDGGPHFLDAPADSPFYVFIETAFNRGIISGYDVVGGREFRWGNSATRSQIAIIAHRALVSP